MNYGEWSKSVELDRTLTPNFLEPWILQNGREEILNRRTRSQRSEEKAHPASVPSLLSGPLGMNAIILNSFVRFANFCSKFLYFLVDQLGEVGQLQAWEYACKIGTWPTWPTFLNGLVGLEDSTAPYTGFKDLAGLHSCANLQTVKLPWRLFYFVNRRRSSVTLEEIGWTPIRLRRWLRVKLKI